MKSGGLAEEVKLIADLCHGIWDEAKKDMLHGLPKQPRKNPLETAREIEAALQAFPPEPWIGPNGTIQIVSPYLVALEYSHGGKTVLDRIHRTYGQEGY